MKIRWTKAALDGFSYIQSPYFTLQETNEYKKSLVKRMEEKIILLGISIPAD